MGEKQAVNTDIEVVGCRIGARNVGCGLFIYLDWVWCNCVRVEGKFVGR